MMKVGESMVVFWKSTEKKLVPLKEINTGQTRWGQNMEGLDWDVESVELNFTEKWGYTLF